jgi:recombination protein RecT
VSNLATIQGDIYSVRPRFEALAGSGLSFDREAGFAVQLLQSNDYALRVATENRQSVINAVTNIAAIGISLNPAKRQAYLVPRDGKICLDISYMGLLDLAIQSGSILWGQAELVYDADQFELNGFDKPPLHKRDPFSGARGGIKGAYVVVKTHSGDYLTTCMSLGEIHDIRDRTKAWKAYIEKKKLCPWVTDEGEMMKKTVIKRAYKLWPKTDKLDNAVHYLNTDGGEGLHLEEPKKTEGPSGPIGATTGALAEQSIEVQNVLRDWAEEIEAAFRRTDGGIDEAFPIYQARKASMVFVTEGGQTEIDAQQVAALWSLLPSDLRTAIKQAGSAIKAAATETA